MSVANSSFESDSASLIELTRDWGAPESVSLYLKRCQVDTPEKLVQAAWHHASEFRDGFGKVVDFGAGDGRFAKFGSCKQYIGYEIDQARSAELGANAQIINSCAFSEPIHDADLCIGNPPFVRNQDLPLGWRIRVLECSPGSGPDLLREFGAL